MECAGVLTKNEVKAPADVPGTVLSGRRRINSALNGEGQLIQNDALVARVEDVAGDVVSRRRAEGSGISGLKVAVEIDVGVLERRPDGRHAKQRHQRPVR